jgi:exopolysaccharide biosynthesis polyprenyl glycosylphosphotransferase
MEVSLSKNRTHILQALFVAVDFFTLVLASIIARNIKFDDADEFDIHVSVDKLSFNVSYALIGWVVAAIWVISIACYGGYKFQNANGGSNLNRYCFNSAFLALGALSLFSYMTRTEYSRVLFILTIPIGLVMVVVANIILRRIVRFLRRYVTSFSKRALLVGDSESIEKFNNILANSREIGYTAAYSIEVDVSTFDQNRDFDRLHDSLLAAIIKKGINSVFVVGKLGADQYLVRQIRWSIEGMGVEFVLDSNLTTIGGNRLHVSALHNLPLLHVDVRQNHGFKFIAKRALDIAFALVALTLTSPILIATALLIKLQDGGPVFFKQTRIGRGGKEFKIIKFRSMVPDAEGKLEEVLREQGKKVEALYKIEHDPRVTRLGRFIRKTSIDELPQFFNVLFGSMSVVGPRPQIPKEIETNSSVYNRRLMVKPGITGPWQVSGRSKLSLQQSIELDISYVENWNFTGDLIIIFRTVREVLKPTGAM